MEIQLTEDQVKQFQEDEYLYLVWGRNRFYVEVEPDGSFYYGEVSSIFNEHDEKKRKSICFGAKDIQKISAIKPYDPSYYHHYPLCPSCGTYMIYHFEYCPKCGQKLDWSE